MEKSPFSIRLVEPTELRSLHSSLMHPKGINANEQAILQAMEDFLLEGEDIYGSFLKEKLVGLIHFLEEPFQKETGINVMETLIGTIFVHPLYRHLGIGRQLVQFAIQQAKTPHVIADPVDDAAYGFFSHLGFKSNYTYNLDEGGQWLLMSESSL